MHYNINVDTLLYYAYTLQFKLYRMVLQLTSYWLNIINNNVYDNIKCIRNAAEISESWFLKFNRLEYKMNFDRYKIKIVKRFRLYMVSGSVIVFRKRCIAIDKHIIYCPKYVNSASQYTSSQPRWANLSV